jgi:hypothetical protein
MNSQKNIEFNYKENKNTFISKILRIKIYCLRKIFKFLTIHENFNNISKINKRFKNCLEKIKIIEIIKNNINLLTSLIDINNSNEDNINDIQTILNKNKLNFTNINDILNFVLLQKYKNYTGLIYCPGNISKLNNINDNKFMENLNQLKLILKNTSVNKLILHNNNLGINCKNLEEIFYMISKSNTKIKSIDLGFNKFGKCKKTINKLKDLIYDSSEKINIKSLELESNLFGVNCDSIKYLIDLINQSDSIEELKLDNNYLGWIPKGLNLLTNGIFDNKNIRKLSLKNNWLICKDENLDYLKELLIKNKYIIYLDLSKNEFGTTSKKNKEIITEMLIYNNYIISLFLEENKFEIHKEENLKFLKEIISNCKNIKYLNLKYNELREIDVVFLKGERVDIDIII